MFFIFNFNIVSFLYLLHHNLPDRMITIPEQSFRCRVNYINLFTMLISQLQRPHCQSVRQKRSQSALTDEPQSDGKTYRCLLSLFADNLNAMIRSNRDCIGQLEMQPKIKISREEQHDFSQHLNQIYPKLVDKLSKQLIYRNTNTRKIYQEYTNSFKSIYSVQNIHEYETNKDQYLEETITSQKNHFNSVPSTKRSANYTSISLAKRPLSSKGVTTGGMTTISQALNNFHSSNGQTYKMKTISAQINQNPQHKSDKRYVMSTQRGILRQQVFFSKKSIHSRQKQQKQVKRYEQDGKKQDAWKGFVFNGSQIMINEKKQNKKQIEQCETKRSPSIFQSTKISCKRMLNLKYSQRKSIDQIQKMQIQNRLMMVNSVLSVNLPQSQGYRPKSKCWQNYFNQ